MSKLYCTISLDNAAFQDHDKFAEVRDILLKLSQKIKTRPNEPIVAMDVNGNNVGGISYTKTKKEPNSFFMVINDKKDICAFLRIAKKIDDNDTLDVTLYNKDGEITAQTEEIPALKKKKSPRP